MPYVTYWVSNPLFLEHGGVRIYQVYKNDQEAEGPREYIYTFDPNGHEDDDSFDVRALPSWRKVREPQHAHFVDPDGRLDWDAYDQARAHVIRTALVLAIDAGELTAPEAIAAA